MKMSWIEKSIESVPRWWIFVAILLVEALSFCSWAWTGINIFAFVGIVLLAIVLSLWRLEWGVLLLLIELFIGSKGHLFDITLFGAPLSIRLALFLVVFAASVVWMIRDKRIGFLHFRYRNELLGLIGVVLLGSLVGSVSGNGLSHVFLDGNGYLYLGLIIPMTQYRWTEAAWHRVVGVLLVAFFAVVVKTLVMLFIFSQVQVMESVAQVVYRWIRDTGVGEITRLDNGFARVFFQHHIYAMVVFFLTLPLLVSGLDSGRAFFRKRANWWMLSVLGAGLLIVFLSGSRSMWVGLISGLLFAATLGLLTKTVTIRRLVATVGVLLFLFVADYGITFGIVNFPLEGTIGVGAGSLLTERTENLGSEAAAAARWNLLPVLANASLEHPLLGSGLGATVTYQSTDPRALEQAGGGKFTTFSFEWGYLDFAYKFGLFGLVVGLWFAWRVGRDGWSVYASRTDRWETLGVFTAFAAIAGTHIFTPYLNHPLGLGWMLVTLLWLEMRLQNKGKHT